MNRRTFLIGIAAGLAPAIIRTPGLLMPVKALTVPYGDTLYVISEDDWSMDLNEAALESMLEEVFIEINMPSRALLIARGGAIL